MRALGGLFRDEIHRRRAAIARRARVHFSLHLASIHVYTRGVADITLTTLSLERSSHPREAHNYDLSVPKILQFIHNSTSCNISLRRDSARDTLLLCVYHLSRCAAHAEPLNLNYTFALWRNV